ncbi:hypothetical protein J4558_10155 [Leptolyngbya sp. 15MV]|nr:hypothetical protein J4558_10155 [Leptolyngbya sp. 15MV]
MDPSPAISPVAPVALDPESADAIEPAISAPAPTGEARTEAARRLLSLLDTTASADPALADVTMARIFRLRAAAARGQPYLSDDDEEAVDGWVLAEQQAARVSPPLRSRAQRLQQIGEALMGGAPVASGDALLTRTLARIAEHEAVRRDAMRLEPARPQRSFRLADLGAVAAMLLVGVGVLGPVFTAAREQARQTLCLSNLGRTASAMSSYAFGHRDALPMATAGLGSVPWWSVNPQRIESNSANLFTLARGGYVQLASLACPGNSWAPMAKLSPSACDWRSLEEISYSYQIMFGAERPRWNSGQRTVVLADRSPVILAVVRGDIVDPLSNSPNHHYRGQHLLWNDGSVTWALTPRLESGDNIWLPRQIERQLDALAGRPLPIQGRETPAAADDVFLGP